MLNELAQQQLQRWGMSAATASATGLFPVEDVAQYYVQMKPGPAIMIPYYNADGSAVLMSDGYPFARVRRLEPEGYQVMGFSKRKPIRYTQPKNVEPHVYFPKGIMDRSWVDIQADHETPLIITEGEAKAICACVEGFQTIALGGVYNFTMPSGRLIAGLDAFVWKMRRVYIVFDSDAVTNPNVLAAEARLIEELQSNRDAKCFVVRLPADGDKKVGLDDYIQKHGGDAFEQLLHDAMPMGTIDAKVIMMNKRYAWIDLEGQIWDLVNRKLMKKDNFTNGSLASAEKIIVQGQKGSKEIGVGEKWLKHKHAQRYSELLFRPSEGQVVQGEHAPALNIWEGWGELEEGDVSPFLRLNEYLFSKLPKEHRDLALKLIAYKAQNPHEKIALAVVLIGKQGSGKTVWGDAISAAFHPYSEVVTPASLSSDFEGWLEKCLIATTNELKPEDMRHNSEKIKALVSDMRRPMNEKYRVPRSINYYGLHIMTSNYKAVGAFAADDRRMFVVETPEKGPQDMYDAIFKWMKAGGGKRLLRYLLTLDLQGWEPPTYAPMTAEKAMASAEALTPVQRLAHDMQHTTQHAIVGWLDMATMWAQANEISSNPTVASRARDVAQHAKGFQIRPWYTPEELAMLFPAVLESVMGSKFNTSTPAGALSRDLRDAGINFLKCIDSPFGFFNHGTQKQYLVVANFKDWEEPITQAQFDEYMREWPTYGQIKAQQAAKRR